jgi:hypothetical protein
VSTRTRIAVGIGLVAAVSLGLALRGGSGAPTPPEGSATDHASTSEHPAEIVDDSAALPRPRPRPQAGREAAVAASVKPALSDYDSRMQAAEDAAHRGELARQELIASNITALNSRAEQAEQEGRSDYAAALRRRADSMSNLRGH